MSGFWTCHECGAEMYGFENCQFCGAHKGGEAKTETNYERLFGTPERAARTLARMCAIGDGSCAGCPMFEANLEHCKSDYTHLKSIVEWLRGDA